MNFFEPKLRWSTRIKENVFALNQPNALIWLGKQKLCYIVNCTIRFFVTSFLDDFDWKSSMIWYDNTSWGYFLRSSGSDLIKIKSSMKGILLSSDVTCWTSLLMRFMTSSFGFPRSGGLITLNFDAAPLIRRNSLWPVTVVVVVVVVAVAVVVTVVEWGWQVERRSQ